MKKDVCFVCVGQCGGNLGSLFVQKGYDVLFVNTAQSDLALIKNAKHVYKIPGVSGCNQNSEKAQSVFAQYYDEIMSKVNSFVSKRIVYFISSSSGGTSGMTPLMVEAFLNYLKEKEDKEWEIYDRECEEGKNPKSPVKRKAGFITVLPSISETVVLNANSYNFMKQVGELIDRERASEISNLANLFLIDNENCSDILKINNDFVNLFDEVLRIPEKHKSVKGNVDPADLEEAITAIGLTVFSKLPKDDFSISALVRSVRTSPIFAQTEETVGQYWVSSTTEELDSIALERELGTPLTHYKTYNDSTNLFVFSGLNLPAERVGLIADRAEESTSVPFNQNAQLFQREVSVKSRVSEAVEQKPHDSIQSKLSAFKRRRS